MVKFSQLAKWLRVPAVAMVVIFLLDFSVKSLFIAFPESDFSYDEKQYLSSAANIWSEHTFGESSGKPWALVPVLYPLLLSRFVALFGPVPHVALYAQAALSGVTACLVYTLARRLAGNWAGWCAGLFYACYVPLMLFPRRFLTETLAVFWIVWCLFVIDNLLRSTTARRQVVWAIVSGASFALMSLTRDISMPLIAVSLVLYLLCHWKCWPRCLAASGAACLAVYSPWVVRNYCTFGRPIVLTSRQSVLGNDFAGDLNRRPYYTAELVRQGYSLQEAIAEYREMKAKGETPDPNLSRLSGKYASHCVYRLGIMLGTHPCLRLPWPFAGHRVDSIAPRPLRGFSLLWHPALFLGVFMACARVLIRRDIRLLHTLALPMALLVLYSLVHAIPRYQVVCYAGLTIPTGVGLSLVIRAVGAKVRRRMRPPHPTR